MNKTSVWFIFGLAIVFFAVQSFGQSNASPSPVNAQLKEAPANTWVLLTEDENGGRDSPMFYYAPNIGRFVLSSGVAPKPQHFDTEFFDAGTAKWINAYPKDSPYTTESGPTDAPSSGYNGWPTASIQTDKQGVSRISMDYIPNAYGSATRAFFQHAFDTDSGKLLAYFRDLTVSYDIMTRIWTDLKAEKFSKTGGLSMMYGSFAYDPINKEVLSIGGTSVEDGGTPGSWTFVASANEWRKLTLGTPELRELGKQGDALLKRNWALANYVRNRFYATESAAEAKVNLKGQISTLAQEVDAFAATLKKTKLSGLEAKAPTAAAAEAAHLASELRALGTQLKEPITREQLALLPGIELRAWQMTRALDFEPAGRGYSQMAVDTSRGKIMLFGGTREDGFLSDTWIYDCKARQWEQRWPTTRPSARSYHSLVWDSASRHFVMYGGKTRDGTSLRDLWLYDVDKNEWKKIAESTEGPINAFAAADGAGQIIAISTLRKNAKNNVRETWGIKIEAAAPALPAEPGDPVVYRLKPADYDSVSEPDPAALATTLKELPVNIWVMLPKPPKGTPTRDWGTLPYDTDRHQMLHWGGGHSTYIGTDLSHYSLRTATWSIGYPAGDPPTRAFFTMWDQTFNNGPQVPNHVWGSAAYDPVSQKGVWMVRGATWTYDPAARSWDFPPVTPVGNELGSSLAPTPKGVVAWTKGKLFLFKDAAREWTELPLDGGKIGNAYGDNTGLCYDSKRDCLWLARDGGPMMRYDMASGDLTTFDILGAKEVFMRETVYVPEIDMLLNEVRMEGEGAAGNLAYDISNNKWIGLDLPYQGDKQFIAGKNRRGFSITTGSRSLHFDPTFNLALQFIGENEVAVLRLSKNGLKTFEVELRDPPKK